jgi:hypothetical protein
MEALTIDIDTTYRIPVKYVQDNYIDKGIMNVIEEEHLSFMQMFYEEE